MIGTFSVLAVVAVALTSARPLVGLVDRAVQELDQAAVAEAQERDETAIRAFSATQIKTGGGKCLSIDPLSGDFRANLTPVQAVGCDGTDGQTWDIVTSGKHNSQPDTMLVVSALTQACLNFDPRRAGGDQVNLFSCGGRADGGGGEADSQLFKFLGGAGPLELQPSSSAESCLAVTGDVLGQVECSSGSNATQSFIFGAGGRV